MKTNKLIIITSIFTFLLISAIAQTPLEKSIVISKENLRQILTNNNKKQTITIVFDGFEVIPIDNNNSTNGISLIKQNTTEINTPKKKALVEVTNNTIVFREFLETNNIKYVLADELKIRTSNIITQEEAYKISSNIIDMAPVLYSKEAADSNKVECYNFRLYYYKTKLYVSMNNYSENLLKGYIDLFQTHIEETKAILNKFD